MLPKRETTDRLVIHFTGTEPTDFHALLIEHQNRGETELGFHFVIDLDGKLLMGRHQSRIGAHHPDFNANSVGICVIGDRYFIGEDQETALILLMDKLRADYPEAEKVNYVYRVLAARATENIPPSA